MKQQLFALLIVFAMPAFAVAGTVVVDTDGPTYYFGSGLGNPLVTNFGQTFTAPAGARGLTLDGFGFYLKGPATETLKGYVYVWDGAKAVGPALYASPVEALSGSGGFDLIEFDSGGIPLTPREQYILLASTADLPDSVGTATMKLFSNMPAVGGHVCFQQSGDDFGAIFTSTWMNFGPATITAFRVTFSGEKVHFVPEPSSLILLGLGALGLIGEGLRRRRT